MFWIPPPATVQVTLQRLKKKVTAKVKPDGAVRTKDAAAEGEAAADV
jgi:hypothetical protein